MEETYIGGFMFLPRETRTKFNELSKEIWGAPSCWMGYLRYGIIEHSEEMTKANFRKKKASHPKSSKYKYYTVDSLYELMVVLKKQMDESKQPKAE